MTSLVLALLVAADATPPPPFSALDQAETWSRLPKSRPALPIWVRILAGPQPRTTAGVLLLDRLHRDENPLGNRLAAKVREAVALELACDYAQKYAAADRRRWEKSKSAEPDLTPETEAELLRLARKLTSAGYTITDAEMAKLIAILGPERAVAWVHTVAFANFHTRILLALKVSVEADGPYPPVIGPFDLAGEAGQAPARPNWSTIQDLQPRHRYTAPSEWLEVKPEQLSESLANQKARQPRISLPPTSRFENLPADVKRQAEKIVWMTVSMGYQPAMTSAWFAAFRQFQQEGRTNPVFSSSLFWVVTRANDCFY